MRPLEHRDPGIAGTVLDNHALYAELICDGIHVAPELIRLWLRMKGEDRAILVTDSISATGMPNGTYKLGNLTIEVSNNICILEGTQTLAGSVLTMDQAIANLQRITGASLATAVRLASHNPATLLGLKPPSPPANLPASTSSPLRVISNPPSSTESDKNQEESPTVGLDTPYTIDPGATQKPASQNRPAQASLGALSQAFRILCVKCSLKIGLFHQKSAEVRT